MRRTYRSKKETGGGLDHRDVLLAVDEKVLLSTRFIYRIWNRLRENYHAWVPLLSTTQPLIKYVKKFVKRIVKEVENTPRDSISRSAYLTPDKSIRVNKGLDLFDQLLGTTSPQHTDLEVKKVDLFDKVRSGR